MSAAVAPVAFYCVSDASYFLGAVGLVNSLRLLGHDEPVYLLDSGMTGRQRELLEPEVTVVDAPEDAPPTLLKAIAPMQHPADTMVLVDTDLVATRRLDDLLRTASEGRAVGFRNDLQRHVPEWGEALGVGPVRRQPYLAFALVAMSRDVGEAVLPLLADLQSRIDFERTVWGRHDRSYALVYADQDILNAILSSRVEADRVVALDERLAPIPPFAGLHVADARRLRCAYEDGTEPYVVHHFFAKPWLEPTHHGVYSQLLRRLLVGDDVAIRVPERMIPLRLRRGPLAYVARKRVNLGQRWRFHVREPLAARGARPGAGSGE